MKTKYLVILGGGIGNSGNLPHWTKNRCDIAIKYFNENKNKEKICFIATSGGTYHYPNPKDKNNFTIFECDLIVKYLNNNGITKNIIYREWSSYDTIGNAFYVRVQITDICDVNDLIIITSKFHYERSKCIFDFIFSLDNKKYNLEYLISDNGNLDLEELKNRSLKEKDSKEKFIKYMKDYNINTLKKFHNWLYSYHDCYKSIIDRNYKIQEKMLYY